MHHRTLGQGFTTSALGLGCMGMSEFYGPRDDATSMQVLHAAVEGGIDMLDTADTYGPHHNETLIGNFLRHGASVKVATKFGIVRTAGEYRRSLDNSPAYIRAACEGSLRRLGREQIDLYYVHRISPDQPIEETMDVLSQLVKQGKIAHIGLCEVSAQTLRRAHAVYPVTAVQTEYSLWTREVADSVLPTCRELGVGFVAYSPLGRGFLTGQIGQLDADDFRRSLPRFQAGAMGTNSQIADRVAQVAARHGCTAAQVSLAWLLAQGPDIVPVPGTKRLRWLHDNIAAANVALTPDELRDLDALSTLSVAGERYTPEGMKGLNA
ncbi:aldo/keto reductase [Thioclava sp. SK-1]|uniref:aldo/keto reductase n=1 Tax=Thioclava sp. SK-1 TaxID=1889770 RepID=UPI00082443AD|nr:aldo/keto reductase [Thioclava sp. SK-1]OCX65605.1 aldo/keto reductase [Thioclava sp. SK-1]